MTPRDEDPDTERAWRDIVDHYGDTPTWDEDAARPEPEPPAERPVVPRSTDDPDAWRPQSWEDEGRFVPPTPPPVPVAEPRRLAAWAGLFVAPLILLVATVFGWYLPGWLSLLLVGWFVGGFGYLVATMDRNPRDPGDDGARL